MQGRPKAIIAGFGCKPPSLDYLRLPSVEITEGGPKRNLGTEALSRAEPEVRIHFPPAKSHANHRFLRGGAASAPRNLWPVQFASLGEALHSRIVRYSRPSPPALGVLRRPDARAHSGQQGRF